MSKTGTYVWRNNRLIKISNEVPRVSFIGEAYVPQGGYVDVHITGKPVEIRCRKQKYALMKEHGVSEYQGPVCKPKPRAISAFLEDRLHGRL